MEIDARIKRMKTYIQNELIVNSNDVLILIREYERIIKKSKKQNIMINLMALDLEKENETKKEIIEKYERKAIKWTRLKKK